jgi:phosphate transport system protein
MAPEIHTDKVYEAELARLRDRLLEMGGMVEAAIAGSVKALV